MNRNVTFVTYRASTGHLAQYRLYFIAVFSAIQFDY